MVLGELAFFIFTWREGDNASRCVGDDIEVSILGGRRNSRSIKRESRLLFES